MRAGGGQPQQPVAGRYLVAIENGVFLDHADTKTRQVIVTLAIHAGHLRGLSARQCRTSQDAAIGYALDDITGYLDIQMSGSIVIQEKQGLGAGDDDIVDTHGDQVDADGVVLADLQGQFQLGANPIGTRHQDRLAVAVQGNFEQGAKSTQATQYAGAQRAFCMGFDAIDEIIPGIDIDPGIAVTERWFVFGFGHWLGPAGKEGDGSDTGAGCKPPEPLSTALRHDKVSVFSIPVIPVHYSTRFQFSILGLLFLVLGFLSPAQAVQVSELFTVQIPVESRERDQRLEAIKQGMEQVLVRVTGDGSIDQNAEVEDVIRGAAQYVQRFRYLPADGGEGYKLVIDYDEARLTKNLANRGLPVWGRERPAVLSWIAVSQGANRYMISAKGQKNERETLSQAATERGIPLIFPVLDVEDRDKVRIGDLVGGFYDTVDEASARYSADAVLVGRVQQQQGLWVGRWRLRDGSQTVVFESEGDSLDKALTQGVYALASYLASWHATQGFSGQGDTVAVHVAEIGSLAGYFRARDYLKSFDAVVDVTPVAITLSEAELNVRLRGTARDLERLILLGDVLQRRQQPGIAEGARLAGSGLYYRLSR